MSNNQNDLNDIMQVLEQNAGLLTEYDRIIPEDDVAVIRSSAWSHVPVVKTEDPEMRYWMQNNQIPIKEQYSHDADKLTKKLFEMRRRSQTASESETRRRSIVTPETNIPQSPEYHYSYDISVGFSAMSMNQPLREADDDSSRSSSPETDDSSVSDWRPGPSSIDTNTNESNSPGPVDPETESRRLSKKQKKTMTEKQLENRRKEANKKNSKNYNRNKKAKEHHLKSQYEQKKTTIKLMKDNEKATRNMIMECYSFTGTVVRISEEDEMPQFIDQTSFIQRMEAIDNETSRRKNRDENIRKLAKSLQSKKKTFKEAKDDLNLKKNRINTYGSRKSRALHSMNIAELELKLAELEFEVQKLSERANLIKTVKKQMASIFIFRYIGAEYLSLPPERRQRFDELCEILKNHSQSTPTASFR